MSEKLRIEIKPITVNGETFKELKMRPPKVKDMLLVERHDGSQAERDLLLAANLCEVPDAVMREMEYKEYKKVVEALKSFL